MEAERTTLPGGGRRPLLLLYILITGASFFMLASRRGETAGAFVFAILQAGMIFYLLPRTKRLWCLIPILLLAAAPVINDSPVWRPYNVIVSLLLYAGATGGLSFRSQGWSFVKDTLSRVFEPFSYFTLPFHWLAEAGGERSSTVKRVLRAVAIAIPAMLVLLAVLSGADMVFSRTVGNFFANILDTINIFSLFRLILSAAVALYLFGLLCSAGEPLAGSSEANPPKKADMLILNILLVSILTVYTVFCVIQFKYLFCGAELPYGLSYTDYARRGFFELLGLSAVNIALILFTVRRRGGGPGKAAANGLCCYMCAVTAVLLVSSFYRMLLYCGDDGLTRLRLFVLGFLIFEALGLAATAVYIFKPVFNPGLVYLGLGLIYYIILNLVPVDYFVAKSQVDMYLSGRRTELYYAFTLSADAAPQLARIKPDSSIIFEKAVVKQLYDRYFDSLEPAGDWRYFNFSRSRAAKIFLGAEEMEK